MAEQWAAVDRYLTELLVPFDATLEEVLEANTDAGLPPHDVSPLQGKLLWMLARVSGARRVLEIGTLGGYSTIWLARALPEGGRVVTLEVDPERAEGARRKVARAGLAAVVDVRVGRALDSLPRLADEGAEPFDFVFLDADKPSNPDYLAWALRLSRRGTLIVADNVVRGGAVADGDTDDASARGVRRFLELVAAEPRLEATALQTVGVKGWDGLAIALVVGDP
jgi:predicted O-methyltransferase YrrM